ncbi:hypothetical protein KKE06_01210 [Candidatus Micrarchaeota archaeon]|nr:hypothetical protein [Candidatus Micrarchaeota archaeon]MBU1930055.1 hypothetical protein [Candidatus Micrarchaeota archaeon]
MRLELQHRDPKPKNQRGFVGPIGDDLPSLIPLTVALLIFFSAFGFAFNSFEEKKIEFDQRLLLLGLGKTMKGDSLLDLYSEWEIACNSLEVSRYNFRAVVFTISTNDGAIFYNYEFFKEWQAKDDPGDYFTWTDNDRIFQMLDASGTSHPLVCDREGTHATIGSLDDISREITLNKNPLRVNYPLAVLDDKKFRPAILSVMVWYN